MTTKTTKVSRRAFVGGSAAVAAIGENRGGDQQPRKIWELTSRELIGRLHALYDKAEIADADNTYFAHHDQREFYMHAMILMYRVEGKLPEPKLWLKSHPQS